MREGRRRAQRPVSYAEHQDEEDDDNSSDDDVPATKLAVANDGDKHDRQHSDAQETEEDRGKSKNRGSQSHNAAAKTTAAKSTVKKSKSTGSAASSSDGAAATSTANKVADGDDHSEPEAEFEIDATGEPETKEGDVEDKKQDSPGTLSPADERSARSSRASRRAAAGGGKVSTLPRPAPSRRGTRARQPVNYTHQLTNEEEEKDDGDEQADDLEEEEEEEETTGRRMRSRGRGGGGGARQTNAKGQKGDSKKKEKSSSNSLVKQFGFKPVSQEDHQAQVDWSTKASSSGRRAKKAKNSRDSSVSSKRRSSAEGGSGTSARDRSQRRSGRIKKSEGERLNYAEHGSSMEEDDDEDEEGDQEDTEEDVEEKEDETEGSYEDDVSSQKKRKRASAKLASKRLASSGSGRHAAGAGGGGGDGGKGGKKAVRSKAKGGAAANKGRLRRSPRDKEGDQNDEEDEVEEDEEEDEEEEDEEEEEDHDSDVRILSRGRSSSGSAGGAQDEKKRRRKEPASRPAGRGTSKSKPEDNKENKVASKSRANKRRRPSGAAPTADQDGHHGQAGESMPDSKKARGNRKDEDDDVVVVSSGRGTPGRGRPRKKGGGKRGSGGKGDGVRASRRSSSRGGRGSKEAASDGSDAPSEGDDMEVDEGDSDSKIGRKSQGEEDEEEDEGEEEEEEEDGEESDEPLRVHKILARKTLTIKEWRKYCKGMNTEQIVAGSIWYQEADEVGDGEPKEKFLIKWQGLSYLHVSWESMEDLVKLVGSKTRMQITKFLEKEQSAELEMERGDGEFFDPTLTQLERVLDVDEVDGEETRLLVKWVGMPYSESTYEMVKDLEAAGQEYTAAVEALNRREDLDSLKKLQANPNRRERKGPVPDLEKKPPVFKNGGELRDYQREGVSWMVYNWSQGRGSILADEMGLGKTLQTVTFISILHKEYSIPGPFLVIAPLSTILHWQREFHNWSDMNAVVFHGGQEDREVLESYELEFGCDKSKREKDKTRLRGRRVWKSTVVVTTPELCIRPEVKSVLGRKCHWDVLVVDEAHRLKNDGSKLNVALKESFKFDSTLLLTGTPLQNNTEELWTLLNLVHEDKFQDKEGFVNEYGDLQRAEDVSRLQARIKPYLLRRMKEDVEKAVPPKEETIIEVELTEIQKQFYRAIYEQNTTFLLQGKRRAQDGPSLMNLAMELRKCCNHPYLITGVEDNVRAQMGDSDGEDKEHLVKYSGKLMLLDKLLPRLREQGHRVLIFSQFKVMLNILEDYLIASDISYGRIDGSIQGTNRQKAIDSFQAPNSDMTVMLLSTKAGGVGITLTAADTCIIYDSDWNPQNDIQAQARCHRIGQTKSVKVYRLLVAKTYEMHMFKTASRKLGLDQAVLSSVRPQGKGNAERSGPTKAEVEKLLKHGAYDVFKEGKGGEEASKKFCEDSIDAILSRAKVINHSIDSMGQDKPSNTFSKASFVSSTEGGEGVELDDPEFWTKCVGLKMPEAKGEVLAKRKARYGPKEYRAASDSDSGSDGGEDDEDPSGNSDLEDAEPGQLVDMRLWSNEEIAEVSRAMMLFGYGRWAQVQKEARGVDRCLEDIAAVCRAMIAVMLETEATVMCKATLKRDRQQEEASREQRREAARAAKAQQEAALKGLNAASSATAPPVPKPPITTSSSSAPAAVASPAVASPPPASSTPAVAAPVEEGAQRNKAEAGCVDGGAAGGEAEAKPEPKPSTPGAPAACPAASSTTTAVEVPSEPSSLPSATKTVPSATTPSSSSTPASGAALPHPVASETKAAAPKPGPVPSPASSRPSAVPSNAASCPAASAGSTSTSVKASVAPSVASKGASGSGGGAAGAAGAGGGGSKASGGGSSSSIEEPIPPPSPEAIENARLQALEMLLAKHRTARVALKEIKAAVKAAEADRKARAAEVAAAGAAATPAGGASDSKDEMVEKGAVKTEVKLEAKDAVKGKADPDVKGGAVPEAKAKADGGAGGKSADGPAASKEAAATAGGNSGSSGAEQTPAGTSSTAVKDELSSKGGDAGAKAAESNEAGGAAAASTKSALTTTAGGGLLGDIIGKAHDSHKKRPEMRESMAILSKVWKPRNVGTSSKFYATLGRISHKLSTLDEVMDLGLMLSSKNPPFGKLYLSVEGWGKQHDRWLAQSAFDLGWFTPMQKKRAKKILEDPYRTWPGGMAKPDHALLGKRLKSLVMKFREERRAAEREEALRKAQEKDEKWNAELREQRRKVLEETQARLRKQEQEIERAKKCMEAPQGDRERVAPSVSLAGSSSDYAVGRSNALPQTQANGAASARRDYRDMGAVDREAWSSAISDSVDAVAAQSADGTVLKFGLFNIGVPISMLLSHDSWSGAGRAGGPGSSLSRHSPLRRALYLTWYNLSQGNGFSTKGVQSVATHLLSKASIIAKDHCGLRLPPSRTTSLGPTYTAMTEKERENMVSMLKAAAYVTQVRASLLVFKELKEAQDYAARLAEEDELKRQAMPGWWKNPVHDAHLLIASCVYGGSSEYGIHKALTETTATILKRHGSCAPHELEGLNRQQDQSVVSAAAGIDTSGAEPMAATMAAMKPPLTPLLARTRIRKLHEAAYRDVHRRNHGAEGKGGNAASGGTSGTCSNTSSPSNAGSGDCIIVETRKPLPVPQPGDASSSAAVPERFKGGGDRGGGIVDAPAGDRGGAPAGGSGGAVGTAEAEASPTGDRGAEAAIKVEGGVVTKGACPTVSSKAAVEVFDLSQGGSGGHGTKVAEQNGESVASPPIKAEPPPATTAGTSSDSAGGVAVAGSSSMSVGGEVKGGPEAREGADAEAEAEAEAEGDAAANGTASSAKKTPVKKPRKPTGTLESFWKSP